MFVLLGGCAGVAYTHGKGTAEVIEDDPRAGIAGVIHLRVWCGKGDGVGDDRRRDEMGASVVAGLNDLRDGE